MPQTPPSTRPSLWVYIPELTFCVAIYGPPPTDNRDKTASSVDIHPLIVTKNTKVIVHRRRREALQVLIHWYLSVWVLVGVVEISPRCVISGFGWTQPVTATDFRRRYAPPTARWVAFLMTPNTKCQLELSVWANIYSLRISCNTVQILSCGIQISCLLIEVKA